MPSTRVLRDALAARPIFDHVPPAAGVVVWWIAFRAPVPADSFWNDFLVGVATIAGLTMAAATFVAALTYQSSNILMTQVRRHYAVELKRNWLSVIGWTFASALASVLALLVVGEFPALGIGTGLYGLALASVKACRALYWLGFTLFGEDLQGRMPGTLPAPPVPADLARGR